MSRRMQIIVYDNKYLVRDESEAGCDCWYPLKKVLRQNPLPTTFSEKDKKDFLEDVEEIYMEVPRKGVNPDMMGIPVSKLEWRDITIKAEIAGRRTR